LRLNNIQTRP